MKNVYKIIAAVICGCMTFLCSTMILASQTPESTFASLILSLAFLSLTVFLIHELVKAKHEMDAGLRQEADQYFEEKQREGDEYLAQRQKEADQYVDNKETQANNYFDTKQKQGDQYLTEKQAEANQLYNGKKAEADQYHDTKITEADQYLKEKQLQADEIYNQRVADGDNYSSNIRAEADTYKSQVDAEVQDLKAYIKELNEQLAVLREDSAVEMVKIDAYQNMRSDEIKNQLTMLQGKQDEFVRSGEALSIIDALTAPKRVIDSQKKQILRCFNSECANLISGTTIKNVDTVRTKIQRSFEAINKIFLIDSVQISQDYLALKFEELSMVYAYLLKEEEEKEQRRAIREQMAEEEKVRREIEAEKRKLEKEEAQFSNEISKLMSYLQKAKDDIERRLYLDKIAELEAKLKALKADMDNILEREQNTRAGFVYIISNIGSFGERVFKIGMTRRLEPMDRIAELSSASVPFPFDVHAMIFSDDAPGLESILHQYFDAERVNKVNSRKEFFRVDLDKIKDVVLKNHNATVKFIDEPDAVEYRETQRINAGAVSVD